MHLAKHTATDVQEMLAITIPLYSVATQINIVIALQVHNNIIRTVNMLFDRMINIYTTNTQAPYHSISTLS